MHLLGSQPVRTQTEHPATNMESRPAFVMQGCWSKSLGSGVDYASRSQLMSRTMEEIDELYRKAATFGKPRKQINRFWLPVDYWECIGGAGHERVREACAHE